MNIVGGNHTTKDRHDSAGLNVDPQVKLLRMFEESQADTDSKVGSNRRPGSNLDLRKIPGASD